jgi:hypothetical protein
VAVDCGSAGEQAAIIRMSRTPNNIFFILITFDTNRRKIGEYLSISVNKSPQRDYCRISPTSTCSINQHKTIFNKGDMQGSNQKSPPRARQVLLETE